MAATVTVVEWNGGTNGSPGYTTLNTNGNGTSRYCNWDNPCIQSLANPCIVPAANFSYSYWKHHSLNISGTYTQVNNIRWYADAGGIGWTFGANADSGLRIGMRSAGDNGCPGANYTVAPGTTANGTNFFSSGGHPYFKTGTGATPTFANNYVAATPVTIDTTNYGPDTSNYSKAILSQVWMSTDATQGVQAAETVTFMYDEI
jgi:hypothetical protein